MKNRKVLFGLCLMLVFTLVPGNRTKADEMNVQAPAQEEIRSYIRQSGADIYDPVEYASKPSAKKPYEAGALSDSTLQSALAVMNQVRYIAGIDADVALDEEYTGLAQAGALVNAANGLLSHNPDKPAGMADSLYEQGCTGASSCNLGMGYSFLGDAIVHGWMDDGDSSNISRVGHRRWILNPAMQKTGFGCVGVYNALYVFDFSRESSYTNVAWPAQNMPLEYWGDYPWSICTDMTEDIHTVCVTMVRQRDQKKWTFSENTSNGYFNVNNGGYGQTGCIIFQPEDVQYCDGDRFDITITGTQNGAISYTVNFFGLTDMSGFQAQQAEIRSVKKQGDKNIEITWKQEKNADGYVVYLSENAKSGYKKIKSVYGSDKTSYVKKNLDTKKTYYVKVKAFAKRYGKTYYTGESDYVKISMKPSSARPTSITSIKAAKKGFTVKWKKQTSQTSGYEIAYCTNKKFPKKSTLTADVKKNKIVSKKITGLKANKTYYVKIRTYKSQKVNGSTKKTYSDWSGVVAVRTRS